MPLIGEFGGDSVRGAGEFVYPQPIAPTIGTATITNSTNVSVAFTRANQGAKADSFIVTSSPGGFTGSGTASPITVNASYSQNVSYTFTVVAKNSTGNSSSSAASNSVIPNVFVPPPYAPPPPPYAPPPYAPPPPPYAPPPPPYAPPPYAPPPPPVQSSCFIAGSQIWMADGSYKAIEDIVAGDEMMSVDIPTFPNGEDWTKWYPSSVWSLPEADMNGATLTTTVVTYNEPLTSGGYRLFNNRIGLTGDHFVMICRDGLWQVMRAWSIEIGDIFLNEQLSEESVSTIDAITENTVVYLLSCGDQYNDLFFGSGICTHNGKVGSSW